MDGLNYLVPASVEKLKTVLTRIAVQHQIKSKTADMNKAKYQKSIEVLASEYYPSAMLLDAGGGVWLPEATQVRNLLSHYVYEELMKHGSKVYNQANGIAYINATHLLITIYLMTEFLQCDREALSAIARSETYKDTQTALQQIKKGNWK